MANQGRRSKIPTGPGVMKDAELVEITESREPWTELTLEDGATVKLKVVVSEVWRVENEFDNEGNPLYIFKASTVTNVRVPDDKKRKVQ